MTYTFDEAIEHFRNNTDISGIVDFLDDVEDTLKELREEYAPTVEMTKEQHDYIWPLIQQGKELGANFTEFWEVYEFIGASKKIDQTFDNQEQAMQVWLHPETSKVVDE